jgi:tetratricopeptide (TPR) repeat protein
MLTPDNENQPKWVQILHAPVRLFHAGLSWLGSASEGFERLFQRASERASGISDAATSADSWLKKLGIALVNPFVWFWNRLINPIGQLLRENNVLPRIARCTLWLLYPFVAIAYFGLTFLQTRNRGLIIWSIPFLAIIGGSLFGMWVISLSGTTVTQKYRKAIDQAISQGEFQQAALYQQKLQTLGIETDRREMVRIRELVKAGKLPEAIDMAERLIPHDRPGSPDLHFWLAGIHIQEQGSLKGAASLDKAVYHLSQLEESLRSANISGKELPPNLVMLKAMVEFRRQNVDEGLALLKEISASFWPALVLQMETHIKLKKDEEAIKDAVALSQAVKREPQLLDEVSAQFFPMWCTALERAGEREELKNAVSLWHKKYPKQQQALQMWAGFQLIEIDNLLVQGSNANLERASKILINTTSKLGDSGQRAITTWVLNRLPPKGTNRNYLQLAEMASKDPEICSTLLEILGTAATLRGEHKLALDLLKRATEKDSQNVIAWNNLAFVANSHFDEEIDLALKAADIAARMQPGNIDVLHTRGSIRAKLKQWELAIEDLRVVVAERPNAGDVHQSLAQAYEALGKKDLAAFHYQLAK